MIHIKQVLFSDYNDKFEVLSGIDCLCYDNNSKIVLSGSFWGKTEILSIKDLKAHIDESGRRLLSMSYVDSQKIFDNFIILKIRLDEISTDDEDMCLVIVPKFLSSHKISSTGQKLFGRYYDEGVFLLKENETITFENNDKYYTLKYLNGNLNSL